MTLAVKGLMMMMMMIVFIHLFIIQGWLCGLECIR